MKTLYLLILFQLILTTCYSQSTYLPLVEENKYWIMKTYNDHEPAPKAISGFIYTFESDTILNEVKYKKLYAYKLAGNHPCQFPPCFEFEKPYKIIHKRLSAFFREDTLNKKVFYLPNETNLSGSNLCQPKECLLYDFSLNTGDTLNEYISERTIGTDTFLSRTVDSIYYRVNEHDQMKINRRLIGFYGLYPFFYCRIFEGLGYGDSGLFVNNLNGDLLDNYCVGSLEDCNIVTSNYNISIDKNIEVFPNPTKGFINIKIQNSINKIEILDFGGRKKVIKNSSTRINVVDLINGLKVLKLIDNKGKVFITKFLKI